MLSWIKSDDRIKFRDVLFISNAEIHFKSVALTQALRYVVSFQISH
jgi:hypothetical protein